MMFDGVLKKNWYEEISSDKLNSIINTNRILKNDSFIVFTSEICEQSPSKRISLKQKTNLMRRIFFRILITINPVNHLAATYPINPKNIEKYIER